MCFVAARMINKPDDKNNLPLRDHRDEDVLDEVKDKEDLLPAKHESDSRRVHIWREANTSYLPSNIRKRNTYAADTVHVWRRMS
ncbi:hypothetical protein AVEN_37051-1 [Araneus ventricosus]|uniref:Uncharacterized protein n=1 Tax=Araneus ventricosus TaxID=182803 RepID=A0A4Y2RAB2_ARAVE|nr:hypothetical protein AVEN_37051-1 [Araneus ventricosus]